MIGAPFLFPRTAPKAGNNPRQPPAHKGKERNTYGKQIRLARMEKPFHATKKSIFRLRMHIFSLKIHIFRLRIHILRLR